MFPTRCIERTKKFAHGVGSHSMSNKASSWGRSAAGRICPPLLVVSDVAAFLPATLLAFAIGGEGELSPLGLAPAHMSQLGAALHGWGSLLVLVALLGYFGRRGHYTARVPFWTQFGDIVAATAVALASDIFLVMAVNGHPVQLEALLRWVLYCPFLMLFRAGARELLRAAGLWRINTLIIADRGVTEQASAALLSDPGLGYAVAGSLELPDAARLTDHEVLDLLSERNAALAIVAVGSGHPEAVRAVTGALRRANCPIALVPTAMDGLSVVGLRQTHFLSHDFMMLVSRNNRARPLGRLAKTLFDQVVSALLVLLLAPLLLVISALVCSDGGPIFSRHPRIGAGGRVFDCLKFRTTAADVARAPKRPLPDEWAQMCRPREASRLTAVGRFLRRSCLDELPQLFNVLRGEMSLVGPRPIVEAEVSRYHDEINYYYEAKPGLTGLWQIGAYRGAPYERQVKLDVWYLRNWTLWHDIAILLKTVPAVFLQRGAL